MCEEKNGKPSDAMSCPHSPLVFTHSSNFIPHVKTYTVQKIQCPDCGRSLSTKETFEVHQKRCHPDRLHAQITCFHCPICPRRYNQKHHLTQHLKRAHKEVFQASLQQPLPDRDSVMHFETDPSVSFEASSENSHPNSKNSAPETQCSFCPQQFPHRYDLMTHLTTMHADLHFAHDLREFERKCHLVNNNSGPPRDELSFHCEICSAKFYDRSELVEHSVLHSSRTPVTCTPDEQRNLSSHSVDSLEFNCETCGAEFGDRSELAEHAASCTPTVFETTCNANSTSVCEICYVQFSDADQLVEHRHSCTLAVTQKQEQSCPSTPVNHNVPNPILSANIVQTQPPSPSFPCKFCPQIFRRCNNLTAHLKRKHLDNLDTVLKDYNKKQEHRKTLKDQNLADSVITLEDQAPSEFITNTLDENSADSVTNQSVIPYYCQFCPAEFYRRYNLMRHLVASHSEKQRQTLASQNASSEIPKHCAPAQKAMEGCSSLASNNVNPTINICEICCIQFSNADELGKHLQHHSHQFTPTTLQVRKQRSSTAIRETSNPILSKLSSVKEVNANADLPAKDTDKNSDIPSTRQSNGMSPPILLDLSKQYPRLGNNSTEAFPTVQRVDKLSDVSPALSPLVNLELMCNNVQYPIKAKLYRCEYCFAKFLKGCELMKHLATRHPDEYVDSFMLQPSKSKLLP